MNGIGGRKAVQEVLQRAGAALGRSSSKLDRVARRPAGPFELGRPPAAGLIGAAHQRCHCLPPDKAGKSKPLRAALPKLYAV